MVSTRVRVVVGLAAGSAFLVYMGLDEMVRPAGSVRQGALALAFGTVLFGALFLLAKRWSRAAATSLIVAESCPLKCAVPVVILKSRKDARLFCYCERCRGAWWTAAEVQPGARPERGV